MAEAPSAGRFAWRAYLRDVLGVLSWRVLQVVGLTLLIAATEGIGLLLLAPLLELTGLDLGGGPMQRLSAAVAWAFGALRLPLTLASVLVVYVGLVVLRAGLNRYATMANFRLQQRFVAQLRERLYRALVRANWLFFARRRSSDFLHQLTRELETVGAATFGLLEWFVTLLMTALYFAYAVFLSPAMTGLVLGAGALLNLGLRREMGRAKDRGAELSRAYETLFAAVGEHLAGMKTVKSHGIEEGPADQFLSAAHGVEAAQVALTANRQGVRFWFQVGATLILALAIYAAVALLDLATANVLLLLYLFSRLIPLLSRLEGGYHAFLGSTPAYVNLRALERDCREAAEAPGTAAPAPPLRRRLTLADVSFSYRPGSLDPVLHHLTLDLEAGGTTAIVGPSGAGKSTVADLVVGLLSPTEGAVLVDGAPLRPEQLPAWRRSLGYVAQDTFVFHDSVRANLRITRPQATDDELAAAIQAASAGFLLGLPEGLDTVLGDRGVRLSGGERQRLALARALLRQPVLLILDEATSSLDVENELRIQGAVDALQGAMTILVIAHRLSTVRNADVIHLLEDGRLVESGSWEALLAQPQGRFRALCRAQGLLTDEAAPTR